MADEAVVYKADCSDPGKAAQTAWAAAVLYARVCGMNADNAARAAHGYAPAYAAENYEAEVQDAWASCRKEE